MPLKVSIKSPSAVNPVDTTAVLNSLTREEISTIAAILGVPSGKSKSNTVSNVAAAILNGKARLKTIVYVSTLPSAQFSNGTTILVKHFHSYKQDKPINHAPPMLVQ